MKRIFTIYTVGRFLSMLIFVLVRRNIEGTKRMRNIFWFSKNHNEKRKDHGVHGMILIGAGYKLLMEYLTILVIAKGPSL